MEQICGIYKITNNINKRCYIGQSINIYKRWNQHKYNSSKSSIIHLAIKKYGVENFSFEIIEQCSQKQLNEREVYWINYYNSYNEGYNLTRGGDGNYQYDYDIFLKLWNEKYNEKEIAQILQCSTDTVMTALHYFKISEQEIRSRGQNNKKRAVVAIDINTKTPLKVFNSAKEAYNFLIKDLTQKNYIYNALSNKDYRWQGYYWEYLNDQNYPKIQLSDQEFLSYRQENLFITKTNIKEQISFSNRKVKRCSRNELKQLIRTTSFTAIGEKFGISDNAIRKWCVYYNLPTRVKDIKNISDEDWVYI